MITKEQYLTYLTERIPVEKFPDEWSGFKRWIYMEDNIAWDQISINGKRYMVMIYNISWSNPPTNIQYFDWIELTPPEAPTDAIVVEEIPDDVAADSLYGMYNPPEEPEEPQPPIQVAIPILVVILALGLLFSVK